MKIGKTLEIDVSQPISLNEDTTLTMYEVSRWCLLLRGVEVIDKKASQLRIDMDKNKNWIKPLALQKYIDAATPAMVTEIVAYEQENIP
jgi:hypothetical protein